jgi:hypothetical protein
MPAEPIDDLLDRLRLVHGVEVQTWRTAIEQLLA